MSSKDISRIHEDRPLKRPFQKETQTSQDIPGTVLQSVQQRCKVLSQPCAKYTCVSQIMGHVGRIINMADTLW